MNTIPLKLKLVLIAVVFLLIIIMYNYIKKKKISIRYSIIWFISSLLMLFCILFPNLLELIAKFIGIETISNMIFLGGFLILIMILFSLTVIVSEQKNKITVLTQELGILKNKLERDDKSEK